MSGFPSVWRVGHESAPLDFVPREFLSWRNRWDDPQKLYRTLYCAESELTCLREVVGDLRPNSKAVADAKAAFGESTRMLRPVGTVTLAWQTAHVMCPAEIETEASACDVDSDVELRRKLQRRLAEALDLWGVQRLDISDIRKPDRRVTQTIGRAIYELGYGLIKAGSERDNEPTYSLFESRAVLKAAGPAIPLRATYEPLRRVCGEYDLRLERSMPERLSDYSSDVARTLLGAVIDVVQRAPAISVGGTPAAGAEPGANTSLQARIASIRFQPPWLGNSPAEADENPEESVAATGPS